MVPSKYLVKAEPLDLMPEGPADDADALAVINSNYSKYHTLKARCESMQEWAIGLQ